MTATFFFLTPMIYLSGFIFPIENMPAVIQPVTYLIPLRYFLVIVRGIFLKGVGLAVLWPQVLALTAWGSPSWRWRSRDRGRRWGETRAGGWRLRSHAGTFASADRPPLR